MRILMLVLALSAASAGLTACNPDPYDPAIMAMSPVNSCGPNGSADINACKSNHH